jgi:hypothetical protein
MSGDALSVESKDTKKKASLGNEILNGALQSPFYPMAYVKVLIQVTFETEFSIP